MRMAMVFSFARQVFDLARGLSGSSLTKNPSRSKEFPAIFSDRRHSTQELIWSRREILNITYQNSVGEESIEERLGLDYVLFKLEKVSAATSHFRVDLVPSTSGQIAFFGRQMTVLYGHQSQVFENVPPNKVGQIIAYAASPWQSKGSFTWHLFFLCQTADEAIISCIDIITTATRIFSLSEGLMMRTVKKKICSLTISYVLAAVRSCYMFLFCLN